ncbi:NADH dehydrogenase [ubiquinone] 1 alpha subcomplex assembly factor 2 isoform X2 [Stegostoma tigrinum]|uniref:NADH dehydrogenase [ubiquinone] 1 alpha subcomplex assembly factor 2 isoform X2 n=1 Tax=Stegostoma tigrinum TaxID=3053191 RepID=UPI00202B39F8|nr:NADH dehydrogenase [ubiquinone] 1 alpha subcomplex assembly factor 2 isoform X2 [Stegostoma tigrinum]
MNQIRTVLQRMFGLVKHHVGTDQFGNKYYYVPEQKSWTGQTIRSKRMIEAVNRKEIEYEVGNIPSEWEAWIRGRREDPPTKESYLNKVRFALGTAPASSSATGMDLDCSTPISRVPTAKLTTLLQLCASAHRHRWNKKSQVSGAILPPSMLPPP